MKKLSIVLENCHGIRSLKTVISYRKSRSAAIYAPNGTMKTSFARTFQDLATNEDTRDNMFPDRVTRREIKDQDDNAIEPSDVVVILSYDEDLGPTEATSTLLVNADLRREYEVLHRELIEARDELAAALTTQAGTRRDVVHEVAATFTAETDGFFHALARIHDEVAAQTGAPYAEVPYDVVFNEKVLPLLDKPEFQTALADYINRLNDLLDESRYFDRETFSYYNATTVTKSLADNGFFAAQHALLLRDGDGEAVEVTDKAQLEQLIGDEKKKIADDGTLRKKMEAIEKALNKNVDVRAFQRYIAEHPELLSELSNVALFRERVWKSYIKSHEELYVRVVQCYRNAEDRKREIEAQAAREQTQWEHVIDLFNKRFFVPFHLNAHNRDQVVLGQEPILKLGFEFDDGVERRVVERQDLLQVLSNGEKKALYILNVLFEVEARRNSERDTLFVIDDIADSFDYKNKYAIIQYLKEMAGQPNFRLMILTHNFDFFRTVESRNVVGYSNCLTAQRNSDGVTVAPASGIKNPFIKDFKGEFYDHPMKRIACIPFIRNILEYTKGETDADYLRLTSLLHWKSDTGSIKQMDLDETFQRVFGNAGSWGSNEEPVFDLILAQAAAALTADEGINFENKIVLSIAIRLVAEQHMVAAIADPTVLAGIDAHQTQALYARYRADGLGDDESRRVLDSVVLMTPENIHVNSFMYEPIIDMSDMHLRELFRDVSTL
ncbi:AAA family ATPase [Pseudonocardia nematodicida]|uniref:AAA family ATPase n=1 Tax=Pseudonocardia nematodicida TaxID=1206997 RepID=A0ABV1KBA2_9PSEU